MPFLYANDLNIEDFVQLVQAFSFQESSILMAFSPARAYFHQFYFDKSFLSETDQGRIFSSDGELKWRHLYNQMRVVYLGNQPPPAGQLEDYSPELNGLQQEMSQFVLWGERTDTKKEWIEQQVPHRFAYPVSETTFRGRVSLEVEKWVDLSGLARFSRYYVLKEIKRG